MLRLLRLLQICLLVPDTGIRDLCGIARCSVLVRSLPRGLLKMASNFLALVAERVAEKIAEQIAQEIPGAVKAVADSIIAEIGSVTEGVSKAIVSESAGLVRQMPGEIADSVLRVIKLGK